MIRLRMDQPRGRGLQVLCLGAHSDDIEIGCAGTLLELARRTRDLHIRWVVFSADVIREQEARASAVDLLSDDASIEVTVLDFRDGFFPDQWAEIKEALAEIASESSPDLILSHWGQDRHQDHTVLSELAWNTFRNHVILEYEVPKYDGDLGQPNVFVPLPRSTAERKADHLMASFPSQRDKAWFDSDTFLALARLRGIECAAEEGHAEAFHGRKLVVTP